MNLSVRFLPHFCTVAVEPPAIAQPHTVAAVRADRTNLRAQPSRTLKFSRRSGQGRVAGGGPRGVARRANPEIWSQVVLPILQYWYGFTVLVWIRPAWSETGR